ncbi:hypothetical protein BDD12DRAFT_201139 [Trichophaea hybrida]|nr:hypothetical protein BDD12DRAFT_201139 [Trichophaea hybrida]
MHPLLYRFVRSTPQRLFCLAGPFTRRPYRACSTSQQHHFTDSPRRHSLVVGNGQPIKFSRATYKDFLELRTKGVAYFDRTRYITTIDSFDEALLFLRPRRFGKSLTLSMLHYFHGMEHKIHYAKAFKNLDVDKDVQDKKIFPNQYLVLELDFSAVRQGANDTYAIDEMVNEALDEFYGIYAPFFGERTPSELADQLIHPTNACVSLQKCVKLVKRTLQEVIRQEKKDHPLAGVKGIYVLIDEYDSFSNAHIDPTSPNWNAMYPAGTIKSFFATMKSVTGPLQLVRYFITGVSPVALAGVSSGFNIQRNVSFLNALSGLCGLTREDVKAALGKLPSHDSIDSVEKELSHLTDFVNGYHFCANGKVDTVFNTTTCMEYFQHRLEKETFTLKDPPHSEVNQNFLSICASSPVARSNLDEALERDSDGAFRPLKYSMLRQEFGLTDLGNDIKNDLAAWQAYVLYHGGFTFDSNNPSKYLKIPNQIAARRIADAVLRRYGLLAPHIDRAVEVFASTGDITEVLELYQYMMGLRDVLYNDFDKNEETHANTINLTILKNVLLTIQPEFKVTQNTTRKEFGHVDLVIKHERHVTVIEWKVIKIDFLEIEDVTTTELGTQISCWKSNLVETTSGGEAKPLENGSMVVVAIHHRAR